MEPLQKLSNPSPNKGDGKRVDSAISVDIWKVKRNSNFGNYGLSLCAVQSNTEAFPIYLL